MDKRSLAAVITDKRRIEMRDFAVPTPRADDAVLKVEACGICGSDYHYYKELDHWPYLNPPHIMGHEVVGRVVAQVVHRDVEQPASDPPADDALRETGVDHLRKDRDDVKSHRCRQRPAGRRLPAAGFFSFRSARGAPPAGRF